MSEEKKPERLDKAAIQALFQASPFISSLDLKVLGMDYEAQKSLFVCRNRKPLVVEQV